MAAFVLWQMITVKPFRNQAHYSSYGAGWRMSGNRAVATSDTVNNDDGHLLWKSAKNW
jgi:hypothetical protein